VNARGLIVSAPRSNSGKTIVTLGLLAALRRKGISVRAAKSGPDYIDPAFHAAATGGKGVNLDSWAMAPSLIDALIADATEDAELLVIEGAMGLFDGVPGTPGRSGAAADLAGWLGLPVLLVLDVSGQSQSAAAVAAGQRRLHLLRDAEIDAALEQPPTIAATPAIGVGTALVVEDDPAVRDMTTHLLRRAGFDVLAVADGVEALAAARLTDQIDVLVTDVVMPKLSGIELAEQMMEIYPLMGVVLLSGYTAETLDLERVTAGGARFISKPVSSNQLLQAVHQAIASRRAGGLP